MLDAMQRAHELQKGVDDLKVALGINKQLGGASKEEIVAGLHEIRESLGISKDPKVAIKQASTVKPTSCLPAPRPTTVEI